MSQSPLKSLVIIGTGADGILLRSIGQHLNYRATYFYDPQYPDFNFDVCTLVRDPIGPLAASHNWIIASPTPEVRHTWEDRLSIDHVHYTDLIHPTAIGIPQNRRTYGIVALPYAVVEPQVVLSPHVYLANHAVIKSQSVLGAYVSVGDHAVIGQNSHIGQGTLIKPGAILPPNTDLPAWSVYPPEGE